jgi:hypothetical protein
MSVDECVAYLSSIPAEKPVDAAALLERLMSLEREQAGLKEQILAQQEQMESMRREIGALKKEKKKAAVKKPPPCDVADHMVAEDPAYSSKVVFPLSKPPTEYVGDMQGLIEDLFFHPQRPSTWVWRSCPKRDRTVLSEGMVRGKQRWSEPDLMENHLITIVSLAVNRIVNETVLAGMVLTDKGVCPDEHGDGIRELVHFGNTGEWSSFGARKKYCNIDIDRLSKLIHRSGRAGGPG